MKFTALSISAIIGLASAIPSALNKRREPSDTNHNSNFDLHCTGVLVANPGGANGAGEGGSSYFESGLTLNPDGQSYAPTSCGEADSQWSGSCQKCTFEGNGLAATTDVTACWTPTENMDGACLIDFTYNDVRYNTKLTDPNGQCGTTRGPSVSSYDEHGICYFDI
ncbi:hypothetical protein BDV19DRAFT_387946 [Aspergillus venezuelensis]